MNSEWNHYRGFLFWCQCHTLKTYRLQNQIPLKVAFTTNTAATLIWNRIDTGILSLVERARQTFTRSENFNLSCKQKSE